MFYGVNVVFHGMMRPPLSTFDILTALHDALAETVEITG